MSEKVLTSAGVSELWDAIKSRSLPVKSVTFDEYGGMSEEEKKSETLYIVSDDTPVTCYRISNPNLLDNWYFADPINQRGEKSYSVNGYTIDRWRTNLASAKVTIVDGKYTTISSDGITIFYQRIEGYKYFQGKTVTCSVLTAENELASLTITCPLAGDVQTKSAYFKGESGAYLSVAGTEASDSIVVRIVNDNSTVNALAAKLELGSVQTLAHKEGDTWVLNDPPPDKALELAKCQRYYEETSFITQLVGSELYHDFISWKVTKRETPTVKIYSRNGEENKVSYWDTSSTWVDTDIRDIRVTKDGVAIYVNRPIATNLDLIISYRICADSNL